jgi:flagellar basal body-associated protein FliL
MSEPTKEENAPKEAGASKLPLIIVGVLALAAGAAVGMFVLPGLLGGPHGSEAEASAEPAEDGDAASESGEKEAGRDETAERAEGGPAGAFSDRIVQFEPFVVNVSGENYPRYLKLQVVFEMRSAESKAKLEERIAQVRDLTISLLSSKRLADITDFEGKALLKDDLRSQVDELLGSDSVESVMFTEFVVQ